MFLDNLGGWCGFGFVVFILLFEPTRAALKGKRHKKRQQLNDPQPQWGGTISNLPPWQKGGE